MRSAKGALMAACAVVAAWSGDMGEVGTSGDVEGDPPAQGTPLAPSGTAPTGSKWQGVEVDGACGGKTIAWVLVDEVCGNTEAPDYLDGFHAPIFRDGALVGSTLFTVDASHLWA